MTENDQANLTKQQADLILHFLGITARNVRSLSRATFGDAEPVNSNDPRVKLGFSLKESLESIETGVESLRKSIGYIKPDEGGDNGR